MSRQRTGYVAGGLSEATRPVTKVQDHLAGRARGQWPGAISESASPEEEVEAVETSEWLADKISELPEREQIVLSLYYNDEMNLKEIGAIIGVSESRVSQILTKVVGKLRDRVAF